MLGSIYIYHKLGTFQPFSNMLSSHQNVSVVSAFFRQLQLKTFSTESNHVEDIASCLTDPNTTNNLKLLADEGLVITTRPTTSTELKTS